MNTKHNRSSAKYANDKLDRPIEVNVEEDVSSRGSSNKFCISTDMAHGDVWKITIIPPQITSSNYTIAPSTRTLSTISEYDSKRDLRDPFVKKENEDAYRNVKIRSEIVSSSPTYQKLNHDYSGHSSSLDKRLISALCGNRKELDDQADEKISKKDTRSKICGDTSNALFIELGAVCKVLDCITNSDSKVSSATNSRCNEISRTLRRALAQRRGKKLEDLLSNDSSLYRCERCGVISCLLRPCLATGRVKENETKSRVTAERDCINNEQNNEEPEISISDVENNVQSEIFVSDAEVKLRVKCKDESSGTVSLPINERAFVTKHCIESPKRANNVSERKFDVKVKNKSYFDNNVLQRLFTDFRNNEEYNSAAQNNYSCNYESSMVTRAYADVDKEEIVRKISYEPKLQIDDSLAGDWRTKSGQKIQGLQRLYEKHNDVCAAIDTVKYLARGQFATPDKGEVDLLSKMQEGRRTRPEDARRGQSSVLYGSRDDCPLRNSGFWLFDKSGHLSEIDERHYLPTLRVDNNRENRNITRHSDTRERKKMIPDSWTDCTEKDSLEDCSVLGQRGESNTTFSSSSAENLIHEWMSSSDKKDEINNIDGDTPRGHRLVSSRPSLNIARHVRAEIARDRISDNRGKSMRGSRTHESNFLARLSPDTRRKIYRVIKKMLSLNSAEDLTFYCERCLMSDVLCGKKLLHARSADATFVHSDKFFRMDKKITNICADDYIPTKLLSAEEKNCWKRDNSANMLGRDSDVSKDAVKILHENMTAPVISDKSGQGEIGSADRKIARRITYRDEPLKDVIGDERAKAEILPIYREILENSGDMDWDNFRALVETLHPGQRKLWRDVCRTIGEEVDGVDGGAEVCIEISPVLSPEDATKTGGEMACAREIVFEMDMTLKDVEGFLNKRSRPTGEERLDTHKNVGEAIADWDRGRRETISKHTR